MKFLLVVFITVLAMGQLPTAEVTGLVTDTSGAAVPGAKVDLVNLATGVHTTTATNTDGNYVFPVVQPATYSVTVTKDGFGSVTRKGIELVVSQVARLDFQLTVGNTTQTVDVSAAPPILESSTASLGQVIGTEQVEDLPLNGRNFLNLARLSTGVLPPKPGDRGAAGGSFAANGVRAQLNNFQLDGVDNNAKIVDQQNSSPVAIQPSIDALQEFKVETNNYSAEYGYSAGAVVNATIKSGTNRFHGDAFEFLRNDVLDARNYFANPAVKKPILQRNQFGGILGGPVIRNNTFFFVSYEGTSQNSGETLTTTVPTAAQKAGNFAGGNLIYDPNTLTQNANGTYARQAFPGNMIPLSRQDPLAVKLLALEPLPNTSQPGYNYVISPVQTDRAKRLDTRGDKHISDKDQFFERYSYFTDPAVNPTIFPAPLVGGNSSQQAHVLNGGQAAALGETHVFGASLVNEFRAGYNRLNSTLSPFGTSVTPESFGFAGIPNQAGVVGLPNITISGFSNLGENTSLPNGKISEALIFEDHVSWIKGAHSMTMGGTYRWVRSYFDASNSARGSFSFSGAFTNNPQSTGNTGSGLADLLVGIPASASLSNLLVGDLRYKYWGAFFQDDWKVTSKLTVNLGVRYELWTQPIERNDQQANFLLGEQKLVFAGNQTPAGIPASLIGAVPGNIGSRSLLITDTNNFAPRLGVAYQLTPSTVLRAGAGTFFADDPFIGASARLPANPPFNVQNSFTTDNVHPMLTLSGGFPANSLTGVVNPATVTLTAFDPNFKQGYVYHWSGGIQKQLKQYVLEANYVGTKGTQLPLTYNVNQDVAGGTSTAARRPFQGFNTITYTTPMDDSSYNALELRAERRYSTGFSLLGSYTYSKTLDIGGEQLIGDLNLRDVNNVKAEHALSAQDLRHNFVASAVYDLPVGKGKHFDLGNSILNQVIGNWQVNGIFTDRTGQPFTPQLGVSSANTGNARPNRIANGNLPSDQRNINNWFNKAAFTVPAQYLYGNAGRDILTGPGAVNLDASLFKRIQVSKLGEAGEVQFRAELFNSLNHPQFALPNARVDLAQGGTITSLSNTMRQVQFGLKVIF
jgi:Carboxypeptidase regulatory-like domain/TonB dependent receptor-like, beta-barrel